MALDGHEQNVQPQMLDGRPVVAQSVRVTPQGRAKLTVDLVAGEGQSRTTSLRVTPGVRGTGVGTVEPAAW